MAELDNMEKELREFYEYVEYRWLKLIGYSFGALVLALVIVLVGRAIYRADHKPPLKTNNTAQHQPAKSTASRPSEPAPVAKSTTTPTSSSLPNSGPGNVVAVFAASALAAAGLHYIVSLRRAKS